MVDLNWHHDYAQLRDQRFRMPEIVSQLRQPPTEFEATQTGADERTFMVPVSNPVCNYNMRVVENTEFVRFETQIARVTPKQELYERLHDINSALFEGEFTVDRADAPGTAQFVNGPDHHLQEDYIGFSKQIRKQGVPNATIVEEMASYDYGVSQAFIHVVSAAHETGAQIMPPTRSQLQSIVPAQEPEPYQTQIHRYY